VGVWRKRGGSPTAFTRGGACRRGLRETGGQVSTRNREGGKERGGAGRLTAVVVVPVAVVPCESEGLRAREELVT
jgi:hypothetical protein